MARKGPRRGLRGTARVKKGGGADRRRDGVLERRGTRFATPGIVIVLLAGLTRCARAPPRE